MLPDSTSELRRRHRWEVGGGVIFSRHRSPSGLLAAVLVVRGSGQSSSHCCPNTPASRVPKHVLQTPPSLPPLGRLLPTVLPDKLSCLPQWLPLSKPSDQTHCLPCKRLALEVSLIITSCLPGLAEPGPSRTQPPRQFSSHTLATSWGLNDFLSFPPGAALFPWGPFTWWLKNEFP